MLTKLTVMITMNFVFVMNIHRFCIVGVRYYEFCFVLFLNDFSSLRLES